MKDFGVVLWTWPDADHDAAVACGICECTPREWKTTLAITADSLERQGLSVRVVTITVAEMLAALESRGMDNTPDNRATIAVEWSMKK